MNLRVLMKPSLLDFQSVQSEGGIRRVVEAYTKHLPHFGVDVVDNTATSYDLIAAHAGMAGGDMDVSHLHGLYWTADYDASDGEYKTNARVIDSLRKAKQVTVPSRWVAYNIARDMRFRPHVVPHGIDWKNWQHQEENQGFILYNKNRVGDVCHPGQMQELAVKFPKLQFVSTFSVPNVGTPSNVKIIGLLPHESMKKVIQRCGVYLSVTKETFAIGVLEAMAAGKPVLGWNYGGNSDLVKHGINGYLAEPGDMNDLAEGLWYTLENAQTLGENGREIAHEYTWERAVKQVTDIYRLASEDKFSDRPMFIEPSSYRTELP
jgi:hypothetical protein